MGPAKRCRGKNVPSPQPFQNHLPNAPFLEKMINFNSVSKKILSQLHTPVSSVTPDVGPDGIPDYTALFVTLAWQCASTWRKTDYSGGCNGAQIRFPPQTNTTLFPNNEGMLDIISVLQVIKSTLPLLVKRISISDMIVLAGQVALKNAGSPNIHHCGLPLLEAAVMR